MRVKNWKRDDELARGITGGTNVKGWYNDEAEEAVVRIRRLRGQDYLVEYFPRPHYSRDSYLDRDGRILFRDSAKQRVDSRIINQLRNYPDGIDTEAVRREELETPTNLWEWAHVFGAAFFGTEKVGNRDESSGDVAIFDGHWRNGEGAYIALATETGSYGKEYISIGTQPNGYYEVSLSGKSPVQDKALELNNPSIEFREDGVIVASTNGVKAFIEPTTKGKEEEAWKEVLDAVSEDI